MTIKELQDLYGLEYVDYIEYYEKLAPMHSMKDYAVYSIFRDSNKRPVVLMDMLTREQAQTIVQNTPSYENSMVVFDKMQ